VPRHLRLVQHQAPPREARERRGNHLVPLPVPANPAPPRAAAAAAAAVDAGVVVQVGAKYVVRGQHHVEGAQVQRV
jgi:hypothetical protein